MSRNNIEEIVSNPTSQRRARYPEKIQQKGGEIHGFKNMQMQKSTESTIQRIQMLYERKFENYCQEY